MRAFALMAAMLASLPAVAQTAQDGLLLEFPADNPVELGYGWNVRAGAKILQTCIDFREATGTYLDRRMSYDYAYDHESMVKSLKVSVSGRVKAIAASGGFAASLSKDQSMQSTSTYVASNAEVWQAPKYVAPVTANAQADAKIPFANEKKDVVDLRGIYQGGAVSILPAFIDLAKNNPGEFYRQCGDSFVAVIHHGARLSAVLTFEETDQKKRQEIAASANGSGATWGFEGSFKSIADEFNSRKKLSIKFEQLGGPADVFPTTLEGLTQAIQKLPEAASKAPRPFRMIVQRYDSLPTFPIAVPSIDLSPEEKISRVYWRLRTLWSLTDEVLQRPEQWLLKLDTPIQSIRDLQDEVLADMKRVEDLAKSCGAQTACDVTSLDKWSDIPYRARLPYRGTFRDILQSPDTAGLDKLPRALAEARTRYWIEEVSRWRCSIDRDCVNQAVISAARADIQKRVTAAIQ